MNPTLCPNYLRMLRRIRIVGSMSISNNNTLVIPQQIRNLPPTPYLS